MDPIKDFLEIVKLSKAQTHRNLVLFPLMAPESGEPDYLTLEEALKEEAVVITEISEGGQVPELKLVNHSESKILILDGEELKGAKQNRIVNSTILVTHLSVFERLKNEQDCRRFSRVGSFSNRRRNR
jgi:hypothetical protein